MCGERPQASNGKGKFKAVCGPCRKKRWYPEYNKAVDLAKRPWRRHVKDRCERCGFVPEHPCQLDVDHIDGNNGNNDPSNYQTLCANCHRLKTYQAKDWVKYPLFLC